MKKYTIAILILLLLICAVIIIVRIDITNDGITDPHDTTESSTFCNTEVLQTNFFEETTSQTSLAHTVTTEDPHKIEYDSPNIVTSEVFSLLFALCPRQEKTTDIKNIWNGSIAESFSSGDGSSTDPYIISSGEELALLAHEVNENGKSYFGEYFRLSNDIFLNDITSLHNLWTPIGNAQGKEFRGYFDGCGYTIHGIYTDSVSEYGGLFGRCAGSPSNEEIEHMEYTVIIENTNIAFSDISASLYSAAICAYAKDNVMINNCGITNSVKLNVKQNSNKSYVGSIVASGNGVKIKNCISSAKIIGEHSYSCGGIASYFYGMIELSAYFGNITSGTTCGLIAGISGAERGNHAGLIRNCVARGIITTSEISMYIGGICGMSGYSETDIYYAIENCIISIEPFYIDNGVTNVGVISGSHPGASKIYNVVYNADAAHACGIASLIGDVNNYKNDKILDNIWAIEDKYFE